MRIKLPIQEKAQIDVSIDFRPDNLILRIICPIIFLPPERSTEIAQMFDKTFEDEIEELDTSKVVVMKDIDLFSYCEHHMALMYDMKATVAYIPNGKVIGLSKIARICDMVGRRLQLQERIGQDIADIMAEITGSEDVAVVLEGYHSCVSARGIKKNNTRTMTVELRGSFKDDAALQMYLR